MKEKILDYLRKNKNKRSFQVVKTILFALLLPFSSTGIIIFQESSLQRTLRLKIIREFWLSSKQPQFSDLRVSHFLSYNKQFPPWLNRGFYSRQAIRKGDKVLDIGCGNGFFDYFFFSSPASSIDAIDINEKALAIARKRYSSSNIVYHKLDFTKSSFPRDKYDVIIMDASIMYFKKNEVDLLMKKICDSMHDKSLFVGSATIGHPENVSVKDPQIFDTPKEMKDFLSKYFQYIKVWSEDEVVYKQVYFRCAKSKSAFDKFEHDII